MKGSFSIEAAIIVPIVIFIMMFTIRSGISLYEETQKEVIMLKEQKTEDVLLLFTQQ